MISTQMRKGILEYCVLKVISNNEEVYGYEISQILVQYGIEGITEGTLYPLLLRMEKNKLINFTLKESSIGPKRKYYKITSYGNQCLSTFYKSWKKLSISIEHLFEE